MSKTNNTLLAIWNTGGKGKSNTILNLANLLMASYPAHKVVFCSKNASSLTIDFRLILEINGRIIALESQGDPNTFLEKRLEDIVGMFNPNLIICSTRTRGETISAVDNIALKYDYWTIWTSTYQMAHSHTLVNNLKAKHLLDLLINLSLI